MNRFTRILNWSAVATTLYASVFISCRNNMKSLSGINTENGASVVHFQPDTVSLIRNPAMGWVLYDDANDNVAEARTYWNAQDSVARAFSSIFYVRWRWADMEPEEGRYAWLYDENFKALIKGASDRGLKLAFRIYIDGQDNIIPGTPSFVKNAGAEGYEVTGLKGDRHWTPYPDDPVFQQKFSNFVRAFAREFDDPAVVDFVDGYNLGWWGEGHHLVFKDKANRRKVFKWIIDLYGLHFSKVLLALTFGSEIGYVTEQKIAFRGQDYILRRDGLGSHWFTQKEKKLQAGSFPRHMFIGESCYWGANTDDIQPWKGDPVYPGTTTWADVYQKTFEDALSAHANCLDLRERIETTGWTMRAPELVKKFITSGGYRLFPSMVSFPETIQSGSSFTIRHHWKNIGVGICPNNNKRWARKYCTAFALLDRHSGKPAAIFTDENGNPGNWLKGMEYTYSFQCDTRNVPAGKYDLAVAIIDRTAGHKASLNLAIQNPETINGWNKAGEIIIK